MFSSLTLEFCELKDVFVWVLLKLFFSLLFSFFCCFCVLICLCALMLILCLDVPFCLLLFLQLCTLLLPFPLAIAFMSHAFAFVATFTPCALLLPSHFTPYYYLCLYCYLHSFMHCCCFHALLPLCPVPCLAISSTYPSPPPHPPPPRCPLFVISLPCCCLVPYVLLSTPSPKKLCKWRSATIQVWTQWKWNKSQNKWKKNRTLVWLKDVCSNLNEQTSFSQTKVRFFFHLFWDLFHFHCVLVFLWVELVLF